MQLMLAVQRGDVRAFETLFRKYVAQVVGFATSFVASRARAEELAQETFVHVYGTRSRYEPRARFSTWLFRIAANLCVSEARRAERRFRVWPGKPDETGQVGEFDPESTAYHSAPSSEDEVVRREIVTQLQAALNRLPPQQRAAVLLARVEGFAYAEVARSLGCTVPAVKSLVHRGTMALRLALSGVDRQ